MILRRLQRRWGAVPSRCLHPRSRAATATSNFFSAPAVAERLVIDHVGHQGDGVAFAEGRSVFVPYTLGGETVEGEPIADHPGRRQVVRVETASPQRIAPFC